MCKRIAVIGNADTCYGYGHYIDSMDVVIRVNFGYMIPDDMKEHIGSKTDLVYHCINFFKQYKLTPPENISFSPIDNVLRTKLRDKYKAVPSSGIMAIIQALHLKPDVLFVSGFSFFRSTYRCGLNETGREKAEESRVKLLKGVLPHKSKADLKIFARILKKNPCIELDDYLTNIFIK